MWSRCGMSVSTIQPIGGVTETAKQMARNHCPDFRHECTKEELWIDSWDTPTWETPALGRKTPLEIAGGGGPRSDNGSHFDLKVDQLSWTAQIAQNAKSGQGTRAIKMYKEMVEAGVKQSSHTFVAALKACSSLRDLRTANRIHEDVVKTGFETDVDIRTMLVGVYAKCGSLVDASCVFEKMPYRDVLSWNAMIFGYAQLGQSAEALQLYARMPQEGARPNQLTFVGALKACSSLIADGKGTKGSLKKQCLEQIKTIHSDAVEGGFMSDLYVGNMLIDVYWKSGSLVDARGVFEKMPYHDVVSWNSIIAGYIQMGQGEEALQLYRRMQDEGVVPDARTFVGALKACSSLLVLEQASKGSAVLVTKQCLEQVRAIHSQVLKSGCESAAFVGTMLVDVYTKCGCLVDARLVFEKMPHRDVVPWNVMILGYAQMEEGAQALQLYKRMQQQGVLPNSRTFVGALKACSSLAPLKEGNKGHLKSHRLQQVKDIHSDVVKAGLESDVLVANLLMDVYGKSGSLIDASHVFEKIPHPNVVSWNIMILGYAKVGEGTKALELYTQMRQEGVAPNNRTFLGALRGCSSFAALDVGIKGNVKQGYLEQVKAIHSDVKQGGFDSDVFVGNMLVDVYAKSGSLVDARCVFEKMPHRDVVSWNSMILGYAHMEDSDQALQLYAQMLAEGVVPDDRTFVAALKACSSMVALEHLNECNGSVLLHQCLEHVKAIHTDIVKSGCESALYVGTMLVDVYAKCGSLVDARYVFEKMSDRDVVSWNSMILGYAQMGQGNEALQLYTLMQEQSVIPDDCTYVCALKACSSLVTSEQDNERGEIPMRKNLLEQVRAIHSELVNRGCELTMFVATMLVDVYAKCESLVDARRIFENMSYRDVVPWTAMILSYAHSGQGGEAFGLYTRMQVEGVVPDDRTFVAVLRACSSMAAMEEGIKCDGILVRKQCLDKVRVIHSEIVKSGFDSDAFVATMLVDVYAKCRSLVDARETFEKMPHRHVASWNAMILGYTQAEASDRALELYARMQQEGVVPNHRTFVVALKACGVVLGLEKGKEIHAQISETGLDVSDAYVASSLIDMYATCGSIENAQRVFDELLTRDVVSWNALIAGYAHQGESDSVFRLFERMRQECTVPNAITLLSILSVCSHVGLVAKGQEIFEAMIRDYAISPTIEHYNCLVDLLGRAGQLDHAMAIATAHTTLQPNLVTWKTVLGACQKWNNVELARQAFERALVLDKDDAAAYVLMSNIYTAANMLENAKQIQAMRLETRAWKEPGQSWWTEISGTVHVFGVGDQEHPEEQHIHTKLQDLFSKVQEEGHVMHNCTLNPLQEILQFL